MEKENNKRLISKIKNFGFSFSCGMFILLLIIFFKKLSYIFLFIVLFLLIYHLLFSIINYKFLYPTYFIITNIAKIIGNIISFLIFSIFFYLFFSPFSIILKLFNKDVIKKYSIKPQWFDYTNTENDPDRITKLY